MCSVIVLEVVSSCVVSIIKIDGKGSADALFERDERLGSSNAFDVLNAVIHQRHQVLVVTGIHFNHHGVVSCGEVAFNDFLDFQEFRNHIAVHGSTFEREPDEGAC